MPAMHTRSHLTATHGCRSLADDRRRVPRGRVADARAQYNAAGPRVHEFPMLAAPALVALGDTGAAIAEVERAVREHDPFVVDLAVDPRLDGLRSHPRFASILAALRFPTAP